MNPGGRLGWWFVGFVSGMLAAILAAILAIGVIFA